MKTYKLALLCLLIICMGKINGQDCYLPRSGATLYTTDDESYNLPAISGLVTMGELQSGSWKIVSTSGTVEASMLDNSGRTSTLQLSGQGDISIENVNTNIAQSQNFVTQCLQTFQVQPFRSEAVTNPDLLDFCPINVVVVIDESASISASNIDESIRNGVMIFGDVLSNSGSQMAVVEYDSKARRVAINDSEELQLVTPEFLSGLSTYLDTEYQPRSDQFKLVGGTNWQDALLYANKVEGADFVLMLTDGSPTFYNTAGLSSPAIAGEGEQFDLTALKHAQDAANSLKQAKKHLFVIGVGMPEAIQPIVDISGNERFEMGGDINSFIGADYTIVTPDEIENIFAAVGVETCGTLIPTVGEWGIINLFLLILIIGVLSLKQNITFSSEMPSTS